MSDLIKREDAIEELADYMYEIALLKADGRLDTMEHYLNRAKAMLKRIPSADRPSIEAKAEEILSQIYDAVNGINALVDRPSGAWKEVVVDDDFPFTRRRFYCSACGGWQTYGRTDYCPNCGARMKDVTEGLESRTDLIWYGDKTDLIGDETGRHTGWFGKGADDED